MQIKQETWKLWKKIQTLWELNKILRELWEFIHGKMGDLELGFSEGVDWKIEFSPKIEIGRNSRKHKRVKQAKKERKKKGKKET